MLLWHSLQNLPKINNKHANEWVENTSGGGKWYEENRLDKGGLGMPWGVCRCRCGSRKTCIIRRHLSGNLKQ